MEKVKKQNSLTRRAHLRIDQAVPWRGGRRAWKEGVGRSPPPTASVPSAFDGLQGDLLEPSRGEGVGGKIPVDNEDGGVGGPEGQ